MMEKPLTIAALQKRAYKIAADKGWHDNDEALKSPLGIGAQLANIHGEVSEALEEARRGRIDLWHKDDGSPQGLGIELADIIIRALDTAETLGIELEPLIEKKMEYNRIRKLRHGGRLF